MRRDVTLCDVMCYVVNGRTGTTRGTSHLSNGVKCNGTGGVECQQ